MTTQQLDQIARELLKQGWEFYEDTFYPVSDNRRMGWWVATYVENPKSSLVPTRRAGDSKPFYYATETTARLYTNIAV